MGLRRRLKVKEGVVSESEKEVQFLEETLRARFLQQMGEAQDETRFAIGGGSEKHETKGKALKGGPLPWRRKLMRTRRQSKGPPSTERPPHGPLLPGGLENSVPNSALSGANEGRGGSDPNWALPGASGLGCWPELAQVAGCCLGPAEVRRT